MPDFLIRKATGNDLSAIETIYNKIHDAEAAGLQTTGWIRGVYPVRQTAEAALQRDDLYVLEENGQVLGAAIINQAQVDVYKQGRWMRSVPDCAVCVLHTLVISPDAAGKGYGRAFVRFYEDLARQTGCSELRLDTNARNTAARALYKKLGYQEIGIVPTVFNDISDVQLVLIEKTLTV